MPNLNWATRGPERANTNSAIGTNWESKTVPSQSDNEMGFG
jgi:hypothetical protein